jgi:hypothetical protein
MSEVSDKSEVMSGITIEELLEIATGLPEVKSKPWSTWTMLNVEGKGFGWISEEHERVTLKSTLDEQAALVAMDPETFAPAYTSDSTAWLQVNLHSVARDELIELVTEAWRLTAPRRLRDLHDI